MVNTCFCYLRCLEALGLGWGVGAVATSPWTGNGFWSTMGGGPGGVGLG